MVFLGKVNGPKTSEIFRKVGPKLGLDDLRIEIYCECEESSECRGVFTPAYTDNNGMPFYSFTDGRAVIVYRFTPQEMEMLGRDYDSVEISGEKEHRFVA